MTADNLRENVSSVLAEHRVGEPGGGTAGGSHCWCSCGYQAQPVHGDRSYALKLALEHQADALLPVIEKATTTARAAGAKEALEGTARDHFRESVQRGDARPAAVYEWLLARVERGGE